jgi:hypothetical protein
VVIELRESSERSREILQPSVFRETSQLICELFLLHHVAARITARRRSLAKPSEVGGKNLSLSVRTANTTSFRLSRNSADFPMSAIAEDGSALACRIGVAWLSLNNGRYATFATLQACHSSTTLHPGHRFLNVRGLSPKGLSHLVSYRSKLSYEIQSPS